MGGFHTEFEADSAEDFDGDDGEADPEEAPRPFFGGVVEEDDDGDEEGDEDDAHGGGLESAGAAADPAAECACAIAADVDGVEEEPEAEGGEEEADGAEEEGVSAFLAAGFEV